MKQINIIYKDRKTSRGMYQTVNVSDMSAAIFAEEFEQYQGGLIKIDSYLYNLLMACKYLSKLEGFEGTPDFQVQEPSWLPKSLEA